MNLLKKHKIHLIYTTCFFLLCIIDQRKGSATGEMQLFWSNFTGLALAPILFVHHGLRSFRNRWHLVWAIVCVTTLPFLCTTIYADYRSFIPPCQWYTAIACIVIYGFLLIGALIELKRNPIGKVQLLFSTFLCVLLVFMGLSHNNSLYPWYYLMVFGTFSLTNFSKNERQSICASLASGIILGFFCLQGLAFVFRPFDSLRYIGMYSNPNANALFYSIVYCAFLAKVVSILLNHSGKYKKILVITSIFFCGALWSFCLLTGCRTAWVCMALSTCLAGGLCLLHFKERVLLKGSAMVLGLALSFIVSFPMVFACIRYLPALFHHPVWFYMEYSEDKVHSWDPIDSEKYTDFDEVCDLALSRLFGISPTVQKAEIDKSDSSSDTSEATTFDSNNSLNIRKHIYASYLQALNLWGHKNEERCLMITDDYLSPHAHDLYLQMAFDFGIPIGILFIVYLLFTITHLTLCVLKGKCFSHFILPLLVINSCVFGIMELMWSNGYLAFTILFLVPTLSTFSTPSYSQHRCSSE